MQIPFQVDEVFTRYLNNTASGFSVYSGEDQHTTYAYDREGFRYTKSDPRDPCNAVAARRRMTAPDPVKGLDTNDEVAFMAADAGPQAPAGAAAAEGHRRRASEVAITDPHDPAAPPVRLRDARARGRAEPAFDASNGYVHYERDAERRHVRATPSRPTTATATPRTGVVLRRRRQRGRGSTGAGSAARATRDDHHARATASATTAAG